MAHCEIIISKIGWEGSGPLIDESVNHYLVINKKPLIFVTKI